MCLCIKKNVKKGVKKVSKRYQKNHVKTLCVLCKLCVKEKFSQK